MSQTSAAPLVTEAKHVGPAIWRRETMRFLLLFFLVWGVLDALYRLLPLIRPGAEIVTQAKLEAIDKPALFAGNARNRIVICGNSRTLAAFMPTTFDATFAGGDVQSFNLGLPGETRFLPALEAALAAGNRPTHVLLTLPWDSAAAEPTLLDEIRDDGAMADRLFPFRHLLRDAALFLGHAGLHPLSAYRRSGAERDQMLEDRGYYFIHADSYYPGDRLPDDFSVPTDHPDRPASRVWPTRSWVKQRLTQLAAQYHFQIVFVPFPARVGEFKFAGRDAPASLHPLMSAPEMSVAGPDALLYPPRDFSDPVHMNPEGAKQYTADLAQMLQRTGVLP